MSNNTAPDVTSNPSDTLTKQLIAATAAVRRVVSIWSGDPRQSVRINLQEFRGVFTCIMQAHDSLRHTPRDPSPPLADVISEYRAALQQLKPHLPRFGGWLLAERARLDARRTHATSVHIWVEANRLTR